MSLLVLHFIIIVVSVIYRSPASCLYISWLWNNMMICPASRHVLLTNNSVSAARSSDKILVRMVLSVFLLSLIWMWSVVTHLAPSQWSNSENIFMLENISALTLRCVSYSGFVRDWPTNKLKLTECNLSVENLAHQQILRVFFRKQNWEKDSCHQSVLVCALFHVLFVLCEHCWK